MCQIIWGDISVIEMRFSPSSCPGLSGGRAPQRSSLGETPELIKKDILLFLAQNKYNKNFQNCE